MKVSGNYDQQTSYERTSVNSKRENIHHSFSIVQGETNVANETKYSIDIWAELAKKYDIRNATFEELEEISMQLYKAGQISLLEQSIMIFDPSKSPQQIKPNLNLTPANQEGRRDWIAEYKTRAERDLKISNLLGYKNNLRIFEVLSRLS